MAQQTAQFMLQRNPRERRAEERNAQSDSQELARAAGPRGT